MDALTRRLAAVLLLLAATVAAQTNVNWNAVKALHARNRRADFRRLPHRRGKIDRTSRQPLALTSGKGARRSFDRQQMLTRVGQEGRSSQKERADRARRGCGRRLGVGFAATGPGSAQGSRAGGDLAGRLLPEQLWEPIVGVVIPSGGWREIYKK